MVRYEKRIIYHKFYSIIKDFIFKKKKLKYPYSIFSIFNTIQDKFYLKFSLLKLAKKSCTLSKTCKNLENIEIWCIANKTTNLVSTLKIMEKYQKKKTGTSFQLFFPSCLTLIVFAFKVVFVLIHKCFVCIIMILKF